jgi:hypothetical protein
MRLKPLLDREAIRLLRSDCCEYSGDEAPVASALISIRPQLNFGRYGG